MADPSRVRLWDGNYQNTILAPLAEIVRRYEQIKPQDRADRVTEFRNEIAEWGHRHLRNRWTPDDEKRGTQPQFVIFAHAFAGQTLVRISALIDVRIREPGEDILLVLKHLMYIDLQTAVPQLHPSLKFAMDRSDPTWLPTYFPGYNKDSGAVEGHPQIHSVATHYSGAGRRKYKEIAVPQNENEFPRLNVRAAAFAFDRAWVGSAVRHRHPLEGNQRLDERYTKPLEKWATFADVVRGFRTMENSAVNTSKESLTKLWTGRSYDLMAYGHSNVAVWSGEFIAGGGDPSASDDNPYRLRLSNVYGTSMPSGWDLVKRETDRPQTERGKMTVQRLAAMVPAPDILDMVPGSIKPQRVFMNEEGAPATSVTIFFDPLFEDGLPLYYYRKHEVTSQDVAMMIDSERVERRQHMQAMLRAKGWLNISLPQYIAKVLGAAEQQKEFHRAALRYINGSAAVWFNGTPEQTMLQAIALADDWVYGKPKLEQSARTAVNFVSMIYERYIESVFPMLVAKIAELNQISYEEPEQERLAREQREKEEARRAEDEKARRDQEERDRQRALEQPEAERERRRIIAEEEEKQEAAERERRRIIAEEEEEQAAAEREEERRVTEERDRQLQEASRPRTPDSDLFGSAIGPERKRKVKFEEAVEVGLRELVERLEGLDKESWYTFPDVLPDSRIDEIQGVVDACIVRGGITEQSVSAYPADRGVFAYEYIFEEDAEGVTEVSASIKMRRFAGIRMGDDCRRAVLGEVEGPPPNFFGLVFPGAYRGKKRRGLVTDAWGDFEFPIGRNRNLLVLVAEVNFGVISRMEAERWMRMPKKDARKPPQGIETKIAVFQVHSFVSGEGNVVSLLLAVDNVTGPQHGFPKDIVAGIMGGNAVGADASQYRLRFLFVDITRAVVIPLSSYYI